MDDTFYPFVENGDGNDEEYEVTLKVRHPARIAVFDDPSAAPRVVVIEPSDIRTYLEQITSTVTRLAQEQGGTIPFTVIREVVENLIHALFMEPTVSILDGGNTIRFSDQGPGIEDKQRALEYGTTSATAEMKRYIRGVGSGLPYAQQWLEDKGGSLTVEDNIHQGTVVTISMTRGAHGAEQQGIAPQMAQAAGTSSPTYLPQGIYQQQQGYMPPGAYPPQPSYPPQSPYQQGVGQSWAAPYPQSGFPYQQQGYPYAAQASPYPAQPPQPYGSPYQPAAAPQVSERGLVILDYLRTHESVGPRDLMAVQALSESTWSRELTQLEKQGLVSKQGGQKRHLTEGGRRFLGFA